MAAGTPQIVSYGLRMLLIPVVKFCLRRAVKFQEFTALARSVFVDAARGELERKGSLASTSRLSVVTGLTRREVDRLVRQAAPVRDGQNLVIKIVGQWASGRQFADAHGRPRKLTFEGVTSEFAKLVAAVSTDLNHHTLLFELERLGFVKRKGSKVSLVLPAYIDRKDARGGVEMLSSDVDDLVSAVEQNVFGSEAVPHLHARTEYDNIVAEKLPDIRQWLLEFGRKVHAEARAYLARFDRDLNPALRGSGARARVKLGTFGYADSGAAGGAAADKDKAGGKTA